MNRCASTAIDPAARRIRERGSVLVIVLWIALGLVTITLYFANSMSSELKASDNRVCGVAAEEEIEGAARYVSAVLVTLATNGAIPDWTQYRSAAVPVGDGYFWLIGRDTNVVQRGPLQPSFGLVDEASKLNLNTAASNVLEWLPRMTADLLQSMTDWRSTNGGASETYYSMQRPAYQCKCAPFETVDELRLVYGTDLFMLYGDDSNLNGALDAGEIDDNQNGQLDPGLLEYLTIYTREPNTRSDGTARINVANLSSSSEQLRTLLETNFNSGRANEIMTRLGLTGGGGGGAGGGPGGGGGAATPVQPKSVLQFYRLSGMTSDEFAQVADAFTVVSGSFIQGRVNVNTASATVLTCLLGGDTAAAQQMVAYRQGNSGNLTSVAWVADALSGSNSEALTALEGGDYITTQSYQFTADIAAVGPYARGYRRVRFVFDLSDGTPRIIYRRDLSSLGWALGTQVRQDLDQLQLAENRIR